MKTIIKLILSFILLQSCATKAYRIDNHVVLKKPSELISDFEKPKMIVLFDMYKNNYFIKNNQSRLMENVLVENKEFHLSSDEEKIPYYFIHQNKQFKLIEKANSISEQVFPLHHSYETKNLKALGNYKLIVDFSLFYGSLNRQQQNRIFNDYVFYIAIPPNCDSDNFVVYEVYLVEIENISDN